MKNLNTTLFDLDVVFTTMSHAETLSAIINLKEVKAELIEIRDECLEETFEFDQNVEEIAFINKQLSYVNKNIRTLENALLCHESKISEKRTSLSDLGTLWLN
jgi:hypothetical protein